MEFGDGAEVATKIRVEFTWKTGNIFKNRN